jgi:hypothetical protein
VIGVSRSGGDGYGDKGFGENVGATLMGSAFLVGPSLGQFYLRDYRQGTNGILVRGGGALVTILGAVMLGEYPLYETGHIVGAVLVLTGVGVFVYGTYYSFRQPYKTHPARREPVAEGARFTLFPTLTRNPDGKAIPGLAARVRF